MGERKGLTRSEHETALVLHAFPMSAMRRIAMAARVKGGAGAACRERLAFRILDHPGFHLTEELLRGLPDEELEAAARRLWIRDMSGRENLIHAILNRPPQPPRRRRVKGRRWRDFPRARDFVRRLGLVDVGSWLAWCRGEMKKTIGTRPPDIPAQPWLAYRDEGWRGLRDWLGLGADRPAESACLPFREARRLARRLRLRNRDQWARWIRGEIADRPRPPPEMPARPDRTYSRAWRDWADWLGLARPSGQKRIWRPFAEAREFARSLGLRGSLEWQAYVKGDRPDLPPLPPDIPRDPRDAYVLTGFVGMADWLGQPWPRTRGWRPFEEVRAFARGLGLSSDAEWNGYAAGKRPELPRLPDRYPHAPHIAYRYRGFAGWGDFLGTGNIAAKNRVFRPHSEARTFARSLGFGSSLDWVAWCRGDRAELPARPVDIPAAPYNVYRGRGWKSWADFLGTRNFLGGWRPFPEARAFARGLKLRGRAEWEAYMRGGRPDLGSPPADLPVMPAPVYRRQGWRGYLDFLDCRRKQRQPRNPMTLEQGRALVRGAGIRTLREWRDWATGRRPDLPPFPTEAPRDPATRWKRRGWRGWSDFLGRTRTEAVRARFGPFEQAREFARGLGLRSKWHWIEWSAGRVPDRPPRPADIPAAPEIVYLGRGWRGFEDWLGPSYALRSGPPAAGGGTSDPASDRAAPAEPPPPSAGDGPPVALR
ncbi:MAG: hypothetical protein MUE73_21700 [Planctomycetes bacterium]|nr:hypothetical protein [Planctomycetota bacterium]